MTKKLPRILKLTLKIKRLYKEFIVHKKSRTYAETLEAFGLAHLINEILQRLQISDRKITIEDKGLYYLVHSNKEITDEMIDSLEYFQVVKFLINKIETPIPQGISKSECYDYPTQKIIADKLKERKKKVLTISNSEHRKKEYLSIIKEQQSEFGRKIDAEYDIYKSFVSKNQYIFFTKNYENFSKNQNNFSDILKEILIYYSEFDVNKNRITSRKSKYKLVDDKPSSQQLLNPHQGQGLNRSKALGAGSTKLKGMWIDEIMKLSGALNMMTVQNIKVGSGYDLKIYVPEFKEIQLSKGKELIIEFKRYLKSASPVKLDILHILDLIIKFIEYTPEYNKGKVKNTIQGFHSTYQKDLGQNKAVANIAFINTPDFIAYSNKQEGKGWMDILKSQRNIISGIEELGDSIQGLQNYRNFLGSIGQTALDYFSEFSYWYASYLMQALDKEKYYVKPFQLETLTKFYENMNTRALNLTKIIENEGFKAVAQAIRKSTVNLQYTPKESRKFDIRYGLAQQLQNKSKTKEDLATFIGEFIGTYNAETARNAEKNGGKSFRANVKDEELIQFFALLDNNPSRLVGALLASYGFALNKKEAPKAEIAVEENLTETES